MGPERLALLCVCVACVVCVPGLAQGEESVVHAKIGGEAELGCSLAPPTSDAAAAPLFPQHVVEWVRRDFDVPVLIKFGPYAPRVHPSFERRVSLSSGATLLVESVRLEDEGWFECRVLQLNRTTGGSVNGSWVFLSVSAPPVFTKTPPPAMEAMQGDSLALTCSAHGNPRPTVIWTKDDMAVEKGEEIEVVDGTLTVRTVTRQTMGVYKCHVSNTEGSLTHTTQLKVKGPPAILSPPKDTTLNISQNAQLRCRAEAYPPNMTYVWWRHGQNVYHIDSLKSRVKILVDGTLLIPSLIPEDSGNYTCMPTNGLLTPPTASAYLTVQHPAEVVQMPQVTYLPAGMGGRIVCPVRAEPPLLSISWTKDGRILDLNMLPGWMLAVDGALFMAAANEDAVGTYTCTPYNSYGTMGPSSPTRAVLQDPPSFSVRPREEYQQKVGTELVIPCHAHGDPSPRITWAKVGSSPRSPFTVAANGSLLLQRLSKDHHGVWQCRAANRVATVNANTRVSVLGTSPHAVSSVSVDPGTNQVNVSWVPGFDGGHAQKFTVWMKQTSGWRSLATSPSAPPLLVTGLLPGTQYQFSVLPHNSVGTGPFSEIAATQTLEPVTDRPPAATTVPGLAPPASLSANQSSIGIVLKWAPPPPQGLPVTGFVLQSRREGEGEWIVLKGDIGANDTEILLQGLQKDCNYELRMLSLRDSLLSVPSQPLNISTAGMGVFLARPRLFGGGPERRVAGILAGVAVLCVVALLLLGTACFLSRGKSHRRRRKDRRDIPSGLQKCPPSKSGSRPDSPDSILKMKACLLNTIFPKSSVSRPELSSSSDDSSCSEGQDQDRQLLPHPKSCLWGCGEGEGSDVPAPAGLESISRGPDGRFVDRPSKDGSASGRIEHFSERPGGGDVLVNSRTSRWACRRPCSQCLERDDLPVVLSVDLPELDRRSCSDSDSCADSSTDPCGSTRRCSPVPGDLAGAFPRWGGRAGFLPQDGAWELVDGGVLVEQMERERDSGHLSRCLTLAREREALERELERCEARLSSRAWRRETGGAPGPREDHKVPKREWLGSGTSRENPLHGGKSCSVPDPRGESYLGADMAGSHVSGSSCAPRDRSPISSISSCVPTPRLEAWPQEHGWEVSGAGPFTSSLPTNPESAGSVKGKRDGDSFTQNSMDLSQQHCLQGGDEKWGRDNGEHSPGSTWPYRKGGGEREHKTRVAESLGMTSRRGSTPSFPESEKEVVMAHLWKSGKYPTDGPRGKSSSTNPIANDDSSSQPEISVSQISGSARPDLMSQPFKTTHSPTDPILKYLSLPGFVEVNVDEPMDENNTAPASSDLNSDQRPGGFSPGESKAVPVAWAAPAQEDREAGSSHRRVVRAGEPRRASVATLREESRRRTAESGAAGTSGRTASSQKQPPGSDRTLRRTLKRSQSLTCETPAGLLTPLSDQTGPSDLHRGRASWGWSLGKDSERASTQTVEGSRTLAHRTHPDRDPVPHGRGQATAVNMNKTFSRGPRRTQREEPPDPMSKKTASLRLQRGHRAKAEDLVSQSSRRADFPSPEVWVRSLSLGSTSKSGLDPLKDMHHNSVEPPSASLALNPLPPATEQRRPPAPPDPRRQAAVFSETPRFPIAYEEAPGPLQLNSVAPRASSMSLYPSNPPNSTKDHPVPLLPSWSQPSHTPFTQREPNEEQGAEHEGEVGQSVEEAMDGSREEEGRGSYASQSSGRGSLGPLSHHSASPSPTLPNSQETLLESKAGGRRRVSVDENYEWDATDMYLPSGSLKASCTLPNREEPSKDMEGGRDCPCPKDIDSKGDPMGLSSSVLKYQLPPGSACSRTCDPDTVLF